MTAVGPLDAMFLLGETREQAMHVGGLMLFELPEGAGRDHVFPEGSRDYVSRLYHEMVAAPSVNPLFARRVRNRPLDLGYWSWDQDDEIDLEYHVRLSALPRPGRFRELFELTSRLHGTLLDRHRPLWEMQLIEGVEGRRFALYSKVHHSMLDGVTALRWMQDTLTTDPTPHRHARDLRAAGGCPSRPGPADGLLTTVARMPGNAGRLLADLAGLTPVGLKSLLHSTVPFQAPRTIFNQSITGARRFAAQSWPIERLEKVRAITGATLNDVMLAMCSGALRNYLLELNALPDKALTAMVPVSLRGSSDAPGGGNSLSTLDRRPRHRRGGPGPPDPPHHGLDQLQQGCAVRTQPAAEPDDRRPRLRRRRPRGRSCPELPAVRRRRTTWSSPTCPARPRVRCTGTGRACSACTRHRSC